MTAVEDEYYFMTEKLEEIEWALDGKCDDIDCNHYMYKDLLKKKHQKFPISHESCIPILERYKLALLRLLSMKKYKKLRY